MIGVSVKQAIKIVSELHAHLNNRIICENKNAKHEYVLDFDDASVIVDLNERSSRNSNGINFSGGMGEIKNSIMKFTPPKKRKNEMGCTFGN